MVLYAPQHQVLISGGKKGEICIFDVRQRQLRQTFQAHESNVAIRCLALDSATTAEECFVTGGSDGDIKVLIHSFIRLLSLLTGGPESGYSYCRRMSNNNYLNNSLCVVALFWTFNVGRFIHSFIYSFFVIHLFIQSINVLNLRKTTK